MAALAEEGEREHGGKVGSDQLAPPSLGGAWYYGGKLPKEVKPATESGSWWHLEDGSFNVRSATYLEDRMKQPSAPAVFQVLSVCSIDASRPLLHVGHRLRPLRELLSSAEHAKSEVRQCLCGLEIDWFCSNVTSLCSGGVCFRVQDPSMHRTPDSLCTGWQTSSDNLTNPILIS